MSLYELPSFEAGLALSHAQHALCHVENPDLVRWELAEIIRHLRRCQKLTAALVAYPYRRADEPG